MRDINLLSWRKESRLYFRVLLKYSGLCVVLLVVAFFYLSRFLHHPMKARVVQPSFKVRVVQRVKLPVISSSFVISDENIKSSATLTSISIANIQWIGFLKQKTQALGFLKLPDGGILSVKVGDKIGREHAEVIFISDQKIILTTQNKKIIFQRSHLYDGLA